MNHPAVSICIPTFSRLHYLKEAVASALAQTWRDLEVLVGDDGDSAEIREWCAAKANDDSRLIYQKNLRRLGLSGNWNALADRARGKYLLIIGDDDRLLPEFVKTLLDAAHNGGVAPALVFCNQHFIDAEGRRLAEETARATERYGRAALPAGLVQHPATFVWRYSFPMSASLVLTDEVRRLRFKSDLNTPDIEFFARLVSDDSAIVFVPAFLAEYRIHVGSATASGLTIDRLVSYLVDIPASPEAAPAKANLLRSMLPSAVSRRLLAGDRDGAATLIRRPEYPRDALEPTILAQRATMSLPAGLACSVYKAMARAKRALPRLRGT